MAGLILCKSKYAERPYYISNMSINIYSLEELCYYIYNNIYLVGADLFDEGLIEFIARDLGEEELSKQLEFVVSQNAGLKEIVMTVLRYVDYYSEDEISELETTIDELDTQNVLERLKARADNFLSNKRYTSALKNYETIVFGKKDMVLADGFYGNVWHNMGVAYAGMFAFSDAIKCFDIAYKMNHSEETLEAINIAKCLENDGEVVDDEDEQAYVASREIETIMDHALDEPGYADVKQTFVYKAAEDHLQYSKAMDELIDKWKADYRGYVV